MELQELFEAERPDLVVFEASTQAGWVADLCAACGVKYAVANANGEAWKRKHVKRKTDRVCMVCMGTTTLSSDLLTILVRHGGQCYAGRLIATPTTWMSPGPPRSVQDGH